MKISVENGNAYSTSRYISNAVRVTESSIIASSFSSISDVVSLTSMERDNGGIIVFQSNSAKDRPCDRDFVEHLKDVANCQNFDGWVAGRFFNGNFSSNGICFCDNSLSVAIFGVDSETLMQIAENFCTHFDQNAALVKDCSTGCVSFAVHHSSKNTNDVENSLPPMPKVVSDAASIGTEVRCVNGKWFIVLS